MVDWRCQCDRVLAFEEFATQHLTHQRSVQPSNRGQCDKIRITRMDDHPYIVWMFSDGDYFLHISESAHTIRRSSNRFRYVRALLGHAREMFKLGRKQLQEEKIP